MYRRGDVGQTARALRLLDALRGFKHGRTLEERTRLSFTCTNPSPVVSWILQWAPHVRVIEPSELAAMVIDELERARAQYMA